MNNMRPVLDGPGPLARRLYQKHTRLWHENVDAQLTGQQFTVLARLTDIGELDHSELSELCYLDKSTLTPILKRLEQRGLVTTRSDDRDLRRKLMVVTAGGAATVRRLTQPAAAVADQLLQNLSPDEQATFLELLRRTVETP